jgi:tetratricopeptide (TPR) repeat protein
MENLLKYCLSIGIFLLLCSCASKTVLYKKEFSEEEKENYSNLLKEGCGLFYQGSTPCQMTLYEARDLNPENADVYQELGAPLLKRGIISQSIQAYNDATNRNQLSWQGWRGYMFLYFYRDYENAIRDFTELDALTPGVVDYPQSESVDFQRGIAWLMMENLEMADSLFTRHIKHESKEVGADYIDSRAFLYRGITYFKKGEFDKALLDFNQGINNLPDNADLLFWKARAQKALGQPDEKWQQTLAESKENFDKGNHNRRPYVEEFFQLYEEDWEGGEF